MPEKPCETKAIAYKLLHLLIVILNCPESQKAIDAITTTKNQ